MPYFTETQTIVPPCGKTEKRWKATEHNDYIHSAYLEVLVLCLEKPVIYSSLLVHTFPILSLRQTVLFPINRISARASFTRVWLWMYFRESVNRRQVSYKNAKTVWEVFWKTVNRYQKPTHWQADPCVNRDKRPWTMGTECFGTRSQWPRSQP